MMPSQILECQGLVLRNLRYGDTSRVATLFTDLLGKVSVIAKGAREPKSPFGAGLELLMHVSYVLYFRSGRDLQLVRAAAVEREFPGLVRDSRRFVYACAVTEYLDRMLLEEEPAPELFTLSLRVLDRIESVQASWIPEVFAAFQLRAAAVLGYAPMLDQCLRCRRPLLTRPESGDAAKDVWVFRPSEGGALCPECAPGAEVGFPVTGRALRRIRSMVRGESRGDERSTDSVVPRGAGTVRESAEEPAGAEARARWNRLLERLVDEFLGYHVDRYRGLRSLDRRLGAVDSGVVSASRP